MYGEHYYIYKHCFLFQVEIKMLLKLLPKGMFWSLYHPTSCQHPLINCLTTFIDQQDQLRLEQLKMYEVLLDQTSARARSLLGHQPFLKPLLEVLNELRWDIFDKYNLLNNLFASTK